MVDITHKSNTLRTAVAQALVRVSDEHTIQMIRDNKIPKGQVFEMAKTAGLLGVKKTSDLIPDCHPLPVEYTGIDFETSGLEITIKVTVKTIYKTGVEVEAMHGASIVALTIYDMLKPVDKGVEIREIKLLEKHGGKSSFKKDFGELKAKVIVCSDSVHQGKKQDKSGLIMVEKLKGFGLTRIGYSVIPDESEEIKAQAIDESSDLIIFTGGTGAGPRDVTPDTIKPLLDIELDGVAETLRRYGQERTPYAMLSRSLAGIRKKTVILSVPGSTGGAREAMDSVFPHLFHIFEVIKGSRHD